jgi:hypothetical protein
MTIREMLAVDFKDIKALEIVCSECGAKVTLPVPKESLSREVSCLGCKRWFWGKEDDREFQFVSGLLLMLTQVQRHDDKAFRLGFSLEMKEER